MSDLNKILKEEYDKKKNTITTQSLMEMIEEMMNLQEAFGLVVEDTSSAAAQQTTQQSGKEMILRWRPYVPVSEIAWGTASGDSNQDARDVDGDGNISDDEKNPARAQLKMYLKNITDGGTDLKAKIDALNSFLTNISKEGDQRALQDMGKSLSFMMFYRTLYDVITDFNASAAGFIFESFLSVLLDAEQGHQVPASGAETIADFIVYAGGRVPISLKVYAESGLKVGGSYKQIVSDLTGEFDMMQYVVVTKQQVGGKDGTPKTTEGLKFAAFNIKLDSLPQILEWTKHGKDQMALPLEVVAAYGADKNIAAVVTALEGQIAGKGFETATVTHSKFGPEDPLDPAQQKRHTIALDIPSKTRIPTKAGVNAILQAIDKEKGDIAAKIMPELPAEHSLASDPTKKEEYKEYEATRAALPAALAAEAKKWFSANYNMTINDPNQLTIGQKKEGNELVDDEYLMSSSGVITPTMGTRQKPGDLRGLWQALYAVIPQVAKDGKGPFTHTDNPSHQVRFDKNPILKYINTIKDAGTATQKAEQARLKGEAGGSDPHTARVTAIYGTDEQRNLNKAISIEILKALGKAEDKEAAKKAWHLTAGYQGIGGDAQFELTGKGTFKKLYTNELIELPYMPVSAEDGTFATVSLKKEDVMNTVNTVLAAFNENMTKALNGMQDLIDDMNSYVLGGLRDGTKAEEAQKDAGVVEDAMTAQYEEHEQQAAAQNVDDE